METSLHSTTLWPGDHVPAAGTVPGAMGPLPAPGGRAIILIALLAAEILLLPWAVGVPEVAVYLRVLPANRRELLISRVRPAVGRRAERSGRWRQLLRPCLVVARASLPGECCCLGGAGLCCCLWQWWGVCVRACG